MTYQQEKPISHRSERWKFEIEEASVYLVSGQSFPVQGWGSYSCVLTLQKWWGIPLGSLLQGPQSSVVVQSLSWVQLSCVQLCDPMDCKGHQSYWSPNHPPKTSPPNPLVMKLSLQYMASLVAQAVKNLLAMQETRALGQKGPLEKGMVIHSNIHAWRILWTEEPGRLKPMGSQRVRHYWVSNTSHMNFGGTRMFSLQY